MVLENHERGKRVKRKCREHPLPGEVPHPSFSTVVSIASITCNHYRYRLLSQHASPRNIDMGGDLKPSRVEFGGFGSCCCLARELLEAVRHSATRTQLRVNHAQRSKFCASACLISRRKRKLVVGCWTQRHTVCNPEVVEKDEARTPSFQKKTERFFSQRTC